MQYGSIDCYQTDDNYLILDTIGNIKYELREINPSKTKLTIINVTLSKEGNIQNWKTLKNLSKQYESWLKENIIEKID